MLFRSCEFRDSSRDMYFRRRVPGWLLITALLLYWGTGSAAPTESCASSPCRNGGTCESLGGDYVCRCPQEGLRYTGRDCGELYDACAFVACPKCISAPGTDVYFCPCPPGSHGDDCQTPVSSCSGDPCHNNGSCREVGHGFECTCPPGFWGIFCEQEVNKCLSEPCKNGAICIDAPGTYQCFCVPGFQGNNCEIDINECASRPCENNGTCVNGKDRYECLCPPGFTGVNCEVDIDECESDPCQNGGTCYDFVDLHTCVCLPGFAGLNCEIDIDECGSQPCENQGHCLDLVNSYKCDCGSTGYTGLFCEEEILECLSNPCQNSATCQEEVNGYRCLCWPGYEGAHCEVDIDECADEPCVNGGTCLQRSDASSYRDGAGFSYAAAEGYDCVCLPGFTGETCSVDVDECQSLPCLNGGSCVDLADAYQCFCPPGFTGADCQLDINECLSEPCQNGASCVDLYAGYTCQCPRPEPGQAPWGGTHCEVLLTGCEDHQCQNGATCWPLLEGGRHSYACKCPRGLLGQHCDEVTTISLTSDPVFVTTDSLTAGPAEDGLRFRTTLPDGILLYRDHEDGHIALEIVGGRLIAQAHYRGTVLADVSLSGRVNDGQWHGVRMSAHGNLTLLLISPVCSGRSCQAESADVGVLGVSAWMAVGGTLQHLLNATQSRMGFVGCMEDLLVASVPVLPRQLQGTVMLGCHRTEWCQPDPCLGHGQCHDLWTGFRCACDWPFLGSRCQEQHPSWTYGHENELSHAAFVIPASHGTNFTISFLLRSLKPDGLVFQLRRGGLEYFTVFLHDGTVQVAPWWPASAPHFVVTTGEWQLLVLDVRHGTVSLHVSGHPTWAGTLPGGTGVSLEAGDMAFVGGLPAGGATSWGGHFKGCLQDLRLGDVYLDLLDMTPEEDGLARYPPNGTNAVQLGCRSDDACRSHATGVALCQNGGECMVTWNDFICVCPSNFTGRRCERLVWCSTDPCPLGSSCVDLDDGYECLANATFDSNSLEYEAHGSSALSVTGVSLNLRTREEIGVVLRASTRGSFFSMALLNSSLLVTIHARNSLQTLSFASEQRVSDGTWHHVLVSMTDQGGAPSRWSIVVDGQLSATSPHASGCLGLVNETSVFLAENFTGCLREVRVGGVYLPFADGPEPPQQLRFLRKVGERVRLGCSGAPVCFSQPCLNNGTCVDLFNVFECTCIPGWRGRHCQEDVDECASSPCRRGACRDLPAAYRCECPPGYGGDACEEDLDNCQGHRCQNGASCQDGVNHYSCVCPLNFTGTFCQWMHPPPQCDDDVQCANGGLCTDGDRGANCTCRPGFTGDRCEEEVDSCQSNPCQNGGTCLSQSGGFQCSCVPGFVGQHCETSKQEHREGIPLLMVAIPLACCCLLLAAIGLAFAVLTARKKRQSEGTYSPSQQEVAGARLEMDSVLKVPPEERLI
ncbi:protein crumbs homolog 2-like [Brienomyrus brachyistius]|uniref:protein crumbs homolog 2-like n=1 Tax=Brienomyrus brachyistius TaxID=42636 RepID=UPI0020B39BF4|nr:protein crumbs homolog 2-like [Brienomyrus brachyistius]